MLKRLTVRGFKSIRALENLELGSLNVLVGANGAGKSNLVALFSLLGAMARENLELFAAREGGSDGLLFGGRETTPCLEMGLEFGGGSGYQVALEPEGARLLVVREGLSARAGPGGARVRELGGGGTEARLAKAEVPAAEDLASEMRDWQVYHFCDTGRRAAVRGEQAVRDNLRLRPDGGNLAAYLRRLSEAHPQDHLEIVRAVRVVAPFFVRFVSRNGAGERMELEWIEKGEPEVVRGPGQMSDGTLRFVCLMTLLLQPTELQPRTIFIDEPELGMHPYALGVLSEVLRDVSRRRQVIVATQCPDLVSGLETEEVVVVNRRGAESSFERPDAERLRHWREDFSLGDLWKMNVIGGRPAW